jgi:hypothetical protein
MYKKWSNVSLFCILLCHSAGSVAGLLLGPELLGYSAIAGAAMTIEAGAVVSNDLGANAAISIGASSDTANIYAGAAVSAGAGSKAGNIYAGDAAGIGAGANTSNIFSGAAVVLGANASAENIYSGAAVGLGAGASAEDVYAAAAITGGGAKNSSAYTSTTTIINAYKETLDIAKAIEQMGGAQASLLDVESDFSLVTTLGSYSFDPGVYAGSALTIAANSTVTFDGNGEESPFWIFNLSGALSVGANNIFEITNAGAGASVIWNIGMALTLGAQTSFIGTTFANGAITGGAGSSLSCGNLFATAAIGIGSVTSTNCIGSDTWEGSINGLTDGLDITNGVVTNVSSSVFSIPEPSTSLLMTSSLFLLSLFGNKKRRYQNKF